MKTISKKTISLSIVSSVLLLSGCSSHEVVSMSNAHAYNENFGLVENYEVDREIQQELLAINAPVEVEDTKPLDPSWSTELILDPEAVTEEEYVQKAPVITYKYKFDQEFYDKAEWRSSEK